jgi:RHS repeat-associated protein
MFPDPLEILVGLAELRVYDAFGKLKPQTPAAVDCVFGHTGKLFDQETGLQNNLNRWYDVSTGKGLSEDSIGFEAGDVDLYLYCENTPASASDPAGQETLRININTSNLTVRGRLCNSFRAKQCYLFNNVR